MRVPVELTICVGYPVAKASQKPWISALIIHMAISSSGLGHRPFTPATLGSNPSIVTTENLALK